VVLRPCFPLLVSSLNVSSAAFSTHTMINVAEPVTYSSTGLLICTFSLPLGRVYSHVSCFSTSLNFECRDLSDHQALLDTLNMRTSVRSRHHSNRPPNLTEISRSFTNPSKVANLPPLSGDRPSSNWMTMGGL
jgi:hypothetical protein